MPLYDFSCQDCSAFCTLLVRRGEALRCSRCGGEHLVKQLAPFAFAIKGTPKTGASVSPSLPQAPSTASGHVCSSGCGHGPSPAGGGCATDAHAASLIKKYLGD